MSLDVDWQKELSETLRLIGFPYHLSSEDVHNFIEFARKYEADLTRITNDQDLFPVAKLPERWQNSPKAVFSSISSQLPIYLYHKPSQSLQRVNDFIESALDAIRSSREHSSWRLTPQETTNNISFAFPWFWLVSMRELQFLERLPRTTGRLWPPTLIRNPQLEFSFEWITWSEILGRWNINNRRLEDCILDFGLPAYRLTAASGIEHAPEDIILKRGQRGDWFPREQTVLFARQEVWAFEEKYGSPKPGKGESSRMILRVNAAKLRAVDLIQEALRSDPGMTTTAVAPYLREKSPKMFGPVYPTDRTLKEYVKGLPLRIQEGRPRKTRSGR